MDDQHLCGKDVQQVRRRKSRRKGSLKAVQATRHKRHSGPPCPPLLCSPRRCNGMCFRVMVSLKVESHDLKAWNFKGERNLRGLILPSLLRRDPRGVVLILISHGFSVFIWKTENDKVPGSEGCHRINELTGKH